VGSHTFGKGLVQTTRDLSYNTKLKVTTAKYYTPSGRCIQSLDYAHRNDDGSVGNVPDSLISEFYTKKGRTVYDGGGIVPDVVLDPEQLSNLSAALITRYLIFDYATYFANENNSISQPEEFEITDDIFDDFKEFVKEKDFEYESKSEQMLNDLKETAQKEKYFELAEVEFEKMMEKLHPDAEKDMRVFSDEIKSLLKSEIVSRYYYQKGAIRASITDDDVISKALEELKSPMSYTEYFNPEIIITMDR
jgi:carboxyl-terminal processing protease